MSVGRYLEMLAAADMVPEWVDEPYAPDEAAFWLEREGDPQEADADAELS